MDSRSFDSGEDCGRLDDPGSLKVAKGFTLAQTASLKASYASGMVGTGKKHQVLIEKAASDTLLTVDQIKVR